MSTKVGLILGPSLEAEHDQYRAIVFRDAGTKLLVGSSITGLVLPSVQIPCYTRVAENLTSALRSKWGCETICLFTLEARPLKAYGASWQVMECCQSSTTHDELTAWVPVSSLSSSSFQNSEDYFALQLSMEQMSHPTNETSEPFRHLGWFRELRAGVTDVVKLLGFELSESFRQFNASPSFSLIRFETNGPAVWFKAVGKPNLQEFPITLKLAQLFPEFLPQILGTRPEWNGWLSKEASGKSLLETGDLTDWERAAAELARLQMESLSNAAAILQAGARDLRSSRLSKSIHPFLEVIASLMKQQTICPPAILKRHHLNILSIRIEHALSLLEAFGIPDTLGHLDINPGNIITSPAKCTFLDWAEAYVGNPFLSFQYLLEHGRRALGEDSATEARLVAAYSAPWKALLAADVIAEALAVAPLIAAFSYALGIDWWRNPERLQDPKIAGYLRSLARRMNREAIRFTERGCHA